MTFNYYRPKPDPDLPTGYVFACSDGPFSRGLAISIAVPLDVLPGLNEDAERRDKAIREEIRLRAATEKSPPAPETRELSLQERVALAPRPRLADNQVDTSAFDTGWRKPRGRDWIRAWEPEGVRAQIDAHNAGTGSSDKMTRVRDQAIYRHMLDGPWRRVGRPADPQTFIRVLRDDYPHLGAAVDILAEHLALSSHAGTPLRFPPLLLVGAPGLGKTHFARRVATLIGVPLRLVDYSAEQANSTLHGTDAHWSNTQHGVLFDLVVMGEYANPVVVLDEIDKAAAGTRYDPLAPLHLALEPSTARVTRDLSILTVFDASWVTYIATANSLKSIPDSLLSRLRLVLCQPPEPRQALDAARAIVRSVMAEAAGKAFDSVAPAVIRELATHTPRNIVAMLTSAMGRAAAAGRRTVELRDLIPSEGGPSFH